MNSPKLFILAAILFLTCTQTPAQSTAVPINVCMERNRITSLALERGNILIDAISHNELGNRIEGAWMSELTNVGVRHVVGVVKFNFTGKQLNLRIDEIFFHKNYYLFSSDDRKLLGNDSVKKERFRELLSLPLFEQSAKMLETTKPPPGYCGTLYVNLLTDSCLPIRNEIPDFEVCSE